MSFLFTLTIFGLVVISGLLASKSNQFIFVSMRTKVLHLLKFRQAVRANKLSPDKHTHGRTDNPKT